jgi:hypothetical protein
MSDDTSIALDTYLIDAVAASAGVRPAGLLNGVTPITASVLTPASAAMVADLKALVGALITAGGGRKVVFIVNPAQAISMGVVQTTTGDFLFGSAQAAAAKFNGSLIVSATCPAGRVMRSSGGFCQCGRRWSAVCGVDRCHAARGGHDAAGVGHRRAGLGRCRIADAVAVPDRCRGGADVALPLVGDAPHRHGADHRVSHLVGGRNGRRRQDQGRKEIESRERALVPNAEGNVRVEAIMGPYRGQHLTMTAADGQNAINDHWARDPTEALYEHEELSEEDRTHASRLRTPGRRRNGMRQVSSPAGRAAAGRWRNAQA